ncbi:unnamed protein product [Adineta steineri]|uniref:Uncharacterized protein n=1 Tax=Adineta steineri TaxID=433720 RepID=A0A819CJK6_9BILA|nr:unnamed protein product [Adineta steineri]CAF1067200.1 unnamed protein product [Adineta steineri]CAF3820427.1 unnamed protein product [Adineta steineri]CAF4181701.1 unnamed protein product [Adineta steineri]
MMIENSIRHINNSNAKVVSLCDIFIVGGVDTDQYPELAKALNLIRTNFINMTLIDSEVSFVDLQAFLERIRYINIIMNYADNSIDSENVDDYHLQRERPISDITIISNKNLQPPLFCIIQYFGREHDGVKR